VLVLFLKLTFSTFSIAGGEVRGQKNGGRNKYSAEARFPYLICQLYLMSLEEIFFHAVNICHAVKLQKAKVLDGN